MSEINVYHNGEWRKSSTVNAFIDGEWKPVDLGFANSGTGWESTSSTVNLNSPGAGWLQSPHTGYWYKPSSVEQTWSQARSEAIAAGGELASIHSLAENDWIDTNIVQVYGTVTRTFNYTAPTDGTAVAGVGDAWYGDAVDFYIESATINGTNVLNGFYAEGVVNDGIYPSYAQIISNRYK